VTAAMRWRLLAVAMMGYAVVQIGLGPVSAIMPTLSSDLGLTLNLSSWLLTGYLLVMTALILPAGRMGDRYGHKRVFMTGLGINLIACILVVLVNAFWSLLILRAVQGAGSALIAGTAMAWVSNAFPRSQRGRVVGAITLASFVGGFVGIYVAIWAVQYATWHWLFLTLAPMALLALLLGATIPEDRSQHGIDPKSRSIDWVGVIVLGLALTTFTLGFTHAHEGEATFSEGFEWHVPMHLAFLVLAALFVWLQRRAVNPIIPLQYLANRPFLAALGAHTVLHIAMMGTIMMIPFMTQVGLGLTPAHTATIAMSVQVLSVVMTPLSGWLYDRADSSLLLPGSMAILGIGMFVSGWFSTSVSYGGLIGLSLFMGLGMGLFLTANNAALVSSVPPEIRGFATGMLETTRQLGHGLATGVIGTFLSHGLANSADTGTVTAELIYGFRLSYWGMAALAVLGVGFSIWHGIERRHQTATLASANASAAD